MHFESYQDDLYISFDNNADDDMDVNDVKAELYGDKRVEPTTVL